MLVSHSNMKSFQKCEYRFYLDTILKLRPKEFPGAMELGIFGHDLMKIYFKALLETDSHDDASEAVVKHVGDGVLSDPTNEMNLERAKVMRHVLAFGAYFAAQPWKAIKSEQVEKYNDRFAFTPDLVCEWTVGPKRGLQFILDYKFTGQYWNERQVNVVQQMPKYAAYYNKIYGTNIRHAGVVMLNTRAKADDKGEKLFLLKWLPMSKEKLENIVKETEVYIDRIEPLFRMEPREVRERVVRTPDEFTCRLCWFGDDICPMDLAGQDTNKVMASNYEINDYGYN